MVIQAQMCRWHWSLLLSIDTNWPAAEFAKKLLVLLPLPGRRSLGGPYPGVRKSAHPWLSSLRSGAKSRSGLPPPLLIANNPALTSRGSTALANLRASFEMYKTPGKSMTEALSQSPVPKANFTEQQSCNQRLGDSSGLRGEHCPKIHHEDTKNHEGFSMSLLVDGPTGWRPWPHEIKRARR